MIFTKSRKNPLMNKNIHLITLLAFIISLLAPACGFAWGGKYSVVDICTTEGIERKVIADNSDDQNVPVQTKDDCQFCSNAQKIDKIAGYTNNFNTDFVQITIYRFASLAILKQNQPNYYQSRAPPSFA